MDTLQNANPLILSAAQLPSRRTPKVSSNAKHGAHSIYDDILSPNRNLSSWPSSDEEDESLSEDLSMAEEPIDEQEIYGRPPPSFYHGCDASTNAQSRCLLLSELLFPTFPAQRQPVLVF